MSDKLLKDGLRDSAKVGAVSLFAELLFIRLILATCPLGRCPWCPDWIRTHALPNRPRTRLTEIAAALETLLSASLVTRYHGPDGTAYLLIPNHGQRFKHAVRSPWPAPPKGPPDVEGQTFMALPTVAPPAAVRKKPKAPGERVLPPLFSSNSSDLKGPAEPEESFEQWVGRLEREWPRINVKKEINTALRKRKEFDRIWFERHWLPGCSEKVGTADLSSPGAVEPEPEAWRQYLKDTYPDESWADSAAMYTWGDMPAHWRAKIAREMKHGRAA